MKEIVLYSSSTCGYCKPVKLMLDNLLEDYNNSEILFETRIIDKDADALSDAKVLGIKGIPTVVVLNGGAVDKFLVGQEITREAIEDELKGNL